MTTTSTAMTVDPAEQASTDTLALVVGSVMDTFRYQTVAYTIQNTGANTINWKVVAGNMADLSDGTDVKASATLAANAFGTYAVSPAPYRYYGIYINAASSGQQGKGLVHGIAKRT